MVSYGKIEGDMLLEEVDNVTASEEEPTHLLSSMTTSPRVSIIS